MKSRKHILRLTFAAMLMLCTAPALKAQPFDLNVKAQSEDYTYVEMLNYFSEAEAQTHFPTRNKNVGVGCSQESCMTLFGIAIDALDDKLQELDFIPEWLLSKIKTLKLAVRFDLASEVQLYVLLRTYNIATHHEDWSSSLYKKYIESFDAGTLSAKETNTLFALAHYLNEPDWSDLRKEIVEAHPLSVNPILHLKPSPNNVGLAKNLLSENPPIKDYKSGRYASAPRIFMFCRNDRSYPCMMVMKDRHNKFHKNEHGKTWTQPSLGLSGHGKQYNERNGNTPGGILRIDGVMPQADQQRAFGKFRRLILNFVESSKADSATKILLPAKHHNSLWWQEASVARDIGRGLLRIHGTGKSSSSKQSYFPFVPTSGCIAKRENTYDGVEFKDQRSLLDELMRAQGLIPSYENEAQIRGLIYIYNLDEKKSPVLVSDLKALGVPL